ncbi:UNVERIFIED_CONTAM: hypothetical protein K2H54_043317 [Gekko kuhli]
MSLFDPLVLGERGESWCRSPPSLCGEKGQSCLQQDSSTPSSSSKCWGERVESGLRQEALPHTQTLRLPTLFHLCAQGTSLPTGRAGRGGPEREEMGSSPWLRGPNLHPFLDIFGI